MKILQREINKKLSECRFSLKEDPVMSIVAKVGNSDYSIRRALEQMQLSLDLDRDEALKEAIQLLVLARVQCEVESFEGNKDPRQKSRTH